MRGLFGKINDIIPADSYLYNNFKFSGGRFNDQFCQPLIILFLLKEMASLKVKILKCKVFYTYAISKFFGL